MSTEPNHPYENESSPDERLDLLQEHLRVRQQGSTVHQFATGDELEIGGRFKKSDLAKQTVIGRDPVPAYPAGPAWTQERAGDEEPLGYSVEAMEPTGESFEVTKSIERLDKADAVRANANEPAQQEPGAAVASPGSPISADSITADKDGAEFGAAPLLEPHRPSPIKQLKRRI